MFDKCLKQFNCKKQFKQHLFDPRSNKNNNKKKRKL